MKYGQIYHQTQYPVLQTWKENAYTTSDEGEEYEQPTGESNSYQQQRNPETAHEKVQHGLRPIHMLADTCTINQNLHEEQSYGASTNDSNEAAHQYHSATWNTWTQGKEIRAAKHYTRQRYLKAVDIVDERYIKEKQLDDLNMSESENRKKKHCHNERGTVDTTHQNSCCDGN